MINSMSMSSYLLKTIESSESTRYGSIIINTANMSDITYTIYINSSSTLSPLIYNNIMVETLANYYHPEIKTKIKFYFDTFPVTKSFLESVMIYVIIIPTFMILTDLVEIFPFNIHFIIKEKADNLREYFYISGVKPVIYWISTILWDSVPFLVVYTFILLLL